MKTKIILSLGLVPVLFVVGQQFLTPPPDEAEFPKEDPIMPADDAISTLVVNRETWNVVDLKNPDADLAAYNTDEMRWARYKATLALEYPEEYRKQFPPTPEQLEREAAAMEAARNPRSLDDLRTSLRPEERAAPDQSIEDILNPEAASQRWIEA